MKKQIITYLMLIAGLTVFAQNENKSNTTESRTFFSYHGAVTMPYGIMLGTLEDLGFYMGAKISSFGSEFTPIGKSYEVCDEQGVTDGVGNYSYRDFYVQSRGSFTGGLTFKLNRNIFGYTGLGYGYSNYWYLFDHFYSDGDFWDQRYIKYEPLSIEGVEFETGGIFNFGSFMFSAGYSTVNFAAHDFTFGLGFSF